MSIKSISILSLSVVFLAACGGPSKESQFVDSCVTIFEPDMDNIESETKTSAELAKNYCGCMYGKFKESLDKEDMNKLTKVFVENKTELDFMDAGEEAFGEKKFRKLGNTADQCDPEL